MEFLPNALDLQLRLGSRVLSFHCLISNNSTNSASCSHVVKHDILKRKVGTVKQKHLDIPPQISKEPFSVIQAATTYSLDYFIPFLTKHGWCSGSCLTEGGKKTSNLFHSPKLKVLLFLQPQVNRVLLSQCSNTSSNCCCYSPQLIVKEQVYRMGTPRTCPHSSSFQASPYTHAAFNPFVKHMKTEETAWSAESTSSSLDFFCSTFSPACRQLGRTLRIPQMCLPVPWHWCLSS